MRERSRIGRRGLVAVSGALVSGVLAAYASYDGAWPPRRTPGYERHLRRWLPIATEFRARRLGLARLLIKLTRTAGQYGLLTPSREANLETNVMRWVRFESRPIYPSGRRGEWGDTGIRWRLQS
ncbi:MAG: hypothetical protein WBW04_16195 [Nitrolancea sp.]